ncbi:YbfB/YjiJ family MFS transporter [Burkholderia thailandensis]|uniref:YbfB/YjiJ family MFS transporter n=1 Tax=Burkholderia thailandensis TaxID=57975 RepID=UPI0004732638|nr:YbfB/YjiJ family MFS transporter [Burkholderia thailandensis]AOJ46931.1 MFS transporter [Burkholderia thailandensis]KVG23780.1 MFS transporter [Burkholderia thailandensis]
MNSLPSLRGAPAAPNYSSSDERAARDAALAGAVALAVALGVGRFAFTPLLPLMLAGGELDIRHGGWLASANYAGYFVGAMTCARIAVDPARMVRAGLAATVALTLAMGVASPFWLWALVRFAGGAVSAWTFVFASQWGLRRVVEHGAPAWGGVIYTGPGLGIVATGLIGFALAGRHAALGWFGFAAASAVLSALVWRAFGAAGRRHSRGGGQKLGDERDAADAGDRREGQLAAGSIGAAVSAANAANAANAATAATTRNFTRASIAGGHEAAAAPAAGTPNPSAVSARRDAFWLVLLYGLPGFGYIITATFLPVIARAALPAHSPWPDLFWPMFGAALIVGALLGARLPSHCDNRLLLAACCAVQAVGVALGIVWPTTPGFALGSVLVGLPFTAITLFAMREARRLRGEHAAGLMGYATASYGVGQIVGPLAAAPLAAHAGSFSPALWLASAVLAVGAAGFAAVASGASRAATRDGGTG